MNIKSVSLISLQRIMLDVSNKYLQIFLKKLKNKINGKIYSHVQVQEGWVAWLLSEMKWLQVSRGGKECPYLIKTEGEEGLSVGLEV